MRLYTGTADEFVKDAARNRIAEKLERAFFEYYRYQPHASERASWRHSLSAMAHVLNLRSLRKQGVLLEYELPLSSKRLDFFVCGVSDTGQSRAVIIELKQWEQCDRCDVDKVVVWLGGKKREVLHPAVQVNQYHKYLADSHTAFHEGESPIGLSSCVYLHNYRFASDDALLDEKFSTVLRESPAFAKDDADALADVLFQATGRGRGVEVLERLDRGTLRPSRKLMTHVEQTIKERGPWVLIDEQLIAFEKVIALVAKRLNDKRKRIVLIRGGPGTGKSVIAINLLAQLLRMNVNAHYATGSKAFTETLWSILGARSKAMFKYFNSYGKAEPDSVDVLICDESHRIRETSARRFMRQADRPSKSQLRELMEVAKIAVFLIDDKQIVRPNEIGSSDYIRAHASELGAELVEFDLETQFRCAGSAGFVNWISNTLAIERNANVLWDGAEGFDFKIFGTVEGLDAAIREKAAAGMTARVAAGFCWPWSPPREDGTLVDDVVIGSYKRPWDAKPGNWHLAPGIPSASLWATDPAGIDQVGCVYNIQGFELDYIGVIWGPDLTYRFDQGRWVGDKAKSSDSVVKRSGDDFVDLVKNTYRVLLSRGMKGCYVFFMDKQTEQFVRSRMESAAIDLKLAAEPESEYRS